MLVASLPLPYDVRHNLVETAKTLKSPIHICSEHIKIISNYKNKLKISTCFSPECTKKSYRKNSNLRKSLESVHKYEWFPIDCEFCHVCIANFEEEQHPQRTITPLQNIMNAPFKENSKLAIKPLNEVTYLLLNMFEMNLLSLKNAIKIFVIFSTTKLYLIISHVLNVREILSIHIVKK